MVTSLERGCSLSYIDQRTAAGTYDHILRAAPLLECLYGVSREDVQPRLGQGVLVSGGLAMPARPSCVISCSISVMYQCGFVLSPVRLWRFRTLVDETSVESLTRRADKQVVAGTSPLAMLRASVAVSKHVTILT